MMRTLLALLSGGLLYAAALAQTPAALTPAPAPTPEQRMIDDIGTHAELMPNLERLCDDIGARLTGSPQLQAAQQWAMTRLRAYESMLVAQPDIRTAALDAALAARDKGTLAQFVAALPPMPRR